MTKKEITLKQILESTITTIKSINNGYNKIVSSYKIEFTDTKQDIIPTNIWIPKFGIKKYTKDYETLANSKKYDYALIDKNAIKDTLLVYYKDNGNSINENLINKRYYYLNSKRDIKQF